jgi:hypothetical protein
MARYDEGVWHRYGLEGPGPEKYRTFLSIPLFDRRWSELGLGDDDRLVLEALVMKDPEAGDVVPGSGGLRKIRFAPPSWRRGKSGGTRVYYAHLPEFGIVVLVSAYAKNEITEVAPDQLRGFRVVVERIRKALSARKTAANGRNA